MDGPILCVDTMRELTSDIWTTFQSIRNRWRPKTLDVLTGFLGTGAVDVVRELNVSPRIVFGLASASFELPVSQIAEIKRLQAVGKVRVSPGLHAKLYLFDDKVLVVGSANFTRAGFEKLREVLVVIDDASVIRAARRLFEEVWSHAKDLSAAKLRPLQADSATFLENSKLGFARNGGNSPFSKGMLGKRERQAIAKERDSVVRLCAYYHYHIDELSSKGIIWSTSEKVRAGDLQLFCFMNDSKAGGGEFVDAAHSLWRATDTSRLDRRRTRWRVQGPFELVVSLRYPVPKADFIRAGLLNKYGRWPQGYRGKIIRNRKKLANVLIARNPGQCKEILRGFSI